VFFKRKDSIIYFFGQPTTKLEVLIIMKTSRQSGIDEKINLTGKRGNAGKV